MLKTRPGTAFALCAALAVVSAKALTLTPENTEVVVAPDASPFVRFAADETTNFVSRVFGRAVPIVAAPTAGRTSIVLGENAWAKAAGLSVDGMPRDTFVSAVKDGRLYILGKDDAKYDIYENLDKGYGHAPLLYGNERATLFGVYDFLERHADCRLYFPGELGECVPRRDRIDVPDGTRTVTPPFLIRNLYLNGTGKWFCSEKADDRTDNRMKSMDWLRLRLSTMEIPCCHGSQWFKYRERFGLKGRPDFMALKKDGTRWLDPKGHFAPNQMCWSNPDLHEEMYQDIKAYLTGRPAASRGLEKWGVNCQWNYVDIMPDDSFSPCECPRCQAAYRFDKGSDFASELLWGVAGKIAQRLIDEGIDGNVTLLAYEPYGRVPEGVDLPTNVYVEVARTGPWTMVDPAKMAHENQLLKEWNAKLGHKVWTWTYPHQFGVTCMKGVSCFAPRAWGKYYRSVVPWTFGTFAECEAEKAMYNHLNYYLFSRVAWDPSVDVDATVDEYYARMFGAGAKEMKEFFDTLESVWTPQIVGKVVNTPVGPVASPPNADQLWTEVLSPAVRVRFDGLFQAAKGKVAAGSPEARRIALMKREFFDDMAEAVAEWKRQSEKVNAYVHDAATGPLRTAIKNCDLWGRPKDAEKLSVETLFTLKRTADALVVDVDCEEPDFGNTVAVSRKDDDIGCWEDNNVEILLNPSDDGKNIYHIMYTTAGNFVDIKWTRVGAKAGKPDVGWSSKGVHTWARTARGWKAHVKIPLASFGEPVKESFRANFGRGRVTRTVNEHAMWSKYAKEYHDFQNWGRVILREAK